MSEGPRESRALGLRFGQMEVVTARFFGICAGLTALLDCHPYPGIFKFQQELAMAMRKLRPCLRFSIQFSFILLLAGLNACTTADRNVAMQHNDNYRTGAYLAETMLTPERVKRQGMHILYWIAPDAYFWVGDPPQPLPCYSPPVLSYPPKELQAVGHSYGGAFRGQLLYVKNVGFNKVVAHVSSVETTTETANGLFAATLCLQINAFNADNGTLEWVANLTQPEPDTCRAPRLLEATPVIDVVQKKMFAVFSTQLAQGCVSNALHTIRYFLASISLVDGSLTTPPVQIRARDDRTGQDFSGENQDAHPGLLLANGSVYVAFGSNAVIEDDRRPYQGWVMRYNEDLQLQNAFCTSCTVPLPNIGDWHNGGGVWQGGGGLAADDDGNIYFLTGNGVADFQPRLDRNRNVENHLYGDSIVKLTISGNKMTPSAFAPEDAVTPDSTFQPPDPINHPLPSYGCGKLCEHDADLGSGGAMLIPQTNLVIGGGKTGVMYVLDRSSMAEVQHFNASTNHYNPELRWQDWDVGPHLHGSPTYWRGPDSRYGYLYVWGEKDYLKMYRFDTLTGTFETNPLSPAAKAGTEFTAQFYKKADILALRTTMPGGMISLSADGNKTGTGIVWATLPIAACMPASRPCPLLPIAPFPVALYAFNAETLDLLWNDASFTMPGAHWAPPTIADGKVFLPLDNGIIVVYEVCQPGMSCTGNSTPITPQQDPPSLGPSQQTIELHKIFPDEAAIRGFVRIALSKITPDPKLRQDLILNGHGVQIYEAVREQTGKRRLVWKATETVEDLAEFRDPTSPQKREPPVKIHIGKGSKWVADDGSAATVRAEKSAPAPVSTNAPWVLFKIVTSAGRGILSTHSFIQCVYTDGGGPPARPPKTAGQVVRVPYRAQYWLYH